jgi:hypothetical protein
VGSSGGPCFVTFCVSYPIVSFTKKSYPVLPLAVMRLGDTMHGKEQVFWRSAVGT